MNEDVSRDMIGEAGVGSGRSMLKILEGKVAFVASYFLSFLSVLAACDIHFCLPVSF